MPNILTQPCPYLATHSGKFVITIACLILLILPCSLLANDNSVVLIASKNTEITEITIIDLRRIYLGITPHKARRVNEPILNLSNEQIHHDFLKNIMRMTDDGYRRKIIKRVFRRGSATIKEAHTTEEIMSHLNENKNNISFIRAGDISDKAEVRII
ncbi:MAG: hypothetical protein EP315_00690, partial [Gammaproteobacteria bacterium]